MKPKEILCKSAMAGCLVAVGCAAFLSCANKYIGALLFTVALCSICNLNLSLCTGMVCYINKVEDIKNLALCLLGNIGGCLAAGHMIRYAVPDISVRAKDLLDSKLLKTPPQIIFASILCGILIYAAVETFKTQQGASRFTGIFTCIPVFILCGFEHSIANISYLLISGVSISVNAVVSLVLCVLGNGIGGLLFPSMAKLYQRK